MYLVSAELSQLQLNSTEITKLLALKQWQGHFQRPDDYPAQQRNTSYQAVLECASTALGQSSPFNYKQALTYLYNNELPGSLTPGYCLELHQQLHPKGGQWRSVTLRQAIPGSPSGEIPASIGGLIQHAEHFSQQGVDSAIIAPLMLLDWLRITPFLDGNLRAGLLLVRAFLQQQGHPLMPYIDLESVLLSDRLVFDQQVIALLSGKPDKQALQQWLDRFWECLCKAYQRFSEALTKLPLSRGSKTDLIKHFIDKQQQPFTLADVSAALPMISTDMIRTVTRQLRDEGILTATSRGRGARWLKAG